MRNGQINARKCNVFALLHNLVENPSWADLERLSTWQRGLWWVQGWLSQFFSGTCRDLTLWLCNQQHLEWISHKSRHQSVGFHTERWSIRRSSSSKVWKKRKLWRFSLGPYIFRKLMTRTIHWRHCDDNDKDTRKDKDKMTKRPNMCHIFSYASSSTLYPCQ